MTLSDQITAKQAELVAARDVLVDLTSNDGETAAIEEATANVEKLPGDLDRLKAAEAAVQKSVARAVSAPAINANPAARLKDKEKADLLVKSALVAFDAYVNRISLDAAIEKRYGDNEVVKTVAIATSKAAQNPAFTGVQGWASELVRDSYAAFMDVLSGESVIPAMPLARYDFAGANSIKIPSRAAAASPNLAGAFRAEGAPIRVGAMSLTSTTLTPKSLGVIGTFSMELLERSTPSIEALIRDAMIADTAAELDAAFLSNTAGSSTVPAGLQTYATGSNTAASAGTTTANIIADIRGRLQQITSLNLGRRLVWVMNPARWYGVQLAVTAAGTPAFPEAANGNLMGVPVVVSTNVPSSIVFLVDAAEVGFAGGAPKFMGTEVATLHEEGASPAPIVSGGGSPATASPVRSLFQTNTAALRAVWEVDWAVMRSGAVQTITSAAW